VQANREDVVSERPEPGAPKIERDWFYDGDPEFDEQGIPICSENCPHFGGYGAEIGAMNVHVCRPRAEDKKAERVDRCPDCGRLSVFVSVFYEWYGWTTTCLKCGRKWQEGEWMPLEFSRTARAESIRSARAAYRSAGAIARRVCTEAKRPVRSGESVCAVSKAKKKGGGGGGR
jgi:hypothetical protein